MIALVGIEWGDFRHGTWSIVVCEFPEWQELVPVVLLVVAVDPDVLFQGLVSVLGLPITFWMVSQGEVLVLGKFGPDQNQSQNVAQISHANDDQKG